MRKKIDNKILLNQYYLPIGGFYAAYNSHHFLMSTKSRYLKF